MRSAQIDHRQMTEPVILKRYPNRKLYNTNSKTYITLSQVAGLIRRGTDIKVIDNVSGADITSVIFTQLILAQEKKSPTRIPVAMLSAIIRSGDQTVNSLSHFIFKAFDWDQSVKDEIEFRFGILVEQGLLDPGSAARILDLVLAVESNHLPNDLVPASWLQRFVAEHIPASRIEFERISEMVDQLTHKVDRLASQLMD